MQNLAPKQAPPLPLAERPPASGGRLGLASAYFTLTCALGACAITGIAIMALGSALRGSFRAATPPVTSVLALAGLTTTAFLTSRLLLRRSRLGALTAVLWVFIEAAGSFVDATSPLTLSLSVIGLGVVGSVWQLLA